MAEPVFQEGFSMEHWANAPPPKKIGCTRMLDLLDIVHVIAYAYDHRSDGCLYLAVNLRYILAEAAERHYVLRRSV